MHYLSYRFSPRPLDFLQVHKYALTLHETPWNSLGLRNWVPRGDRRRSGRNSGELAGARGRERPGNARGVPRARFAPDLEAEAAPAHGLDGTRQRPALCACLRRGRRPAETMRGRVSSPTTQGEAPGNLLTRGERGAAAQLGRRPWRGGGRGCRAAMVLWTARGGEVAQVLNRCSFYDLERGGTEGKPQRAAARAASGSAGGSGHSPACARLGTQRGQRGFRGVSTCVPLLTQNVHSTPITQQAEKASFARAESE
jgi:hypothetical protein